MIVFLGSNPSQAAKTLEPFRDARSSKILNNWIQILNLSLGTYKFCNVVDLKTPKNRPLTKEEINFAIPELRAKIEGCFVVCLGSTAYQVCRLISQDVSVQILTGGTDYKMFRYVKFHHPSGLNRKLNNKTFVDEELRKLKRTYEELFTYKLIKIYSDIGIIENRNILLDFMPVFFDMTDMLNVN